MVFPLYRLLVLVFTKAVLVSFLPGLIYDVASRDQTIGARIATTGQSCMTVCSKHLANLTPRKLFLHPSMITISYLCCYRARASEETSSGPERSSNAISQTCQDRIDGTESLANTETESLHLPVRPEPVRYLRGVARRSGIDSGMSSSRDRLESTNSNLAGSKSYDARKPQPSRQLNVFERCGVEDDDLSIISDPNALYLGPLITVSSGSTGIRAISSSDKTERDTMQSSASIATAILSPRTREEPAYTDNPVAGCSRHRDPSLKTCGGESTTTSKVDSLLLDDDPSSPFRTWLLTQTPDIENSSSRRTDASTPSNPRTIPAKSSHDPKKNRKQNQKARSHNLTPVPGSGKTARAEEQEYERRHPSTSSGPCQDSHDYTTTNRNIYPYDTKYSQSNNASQSSRAPGINTHSTSAGARKMHLSFPSCR